MEARVLCIWIMAVGLLATDDIAAQSPGKIYRCIVNEQIVFTDRACAGGEAGSEVELAPVNLSSAATVESSTRSRTVRESNRSSDRATARQNSIAAEQARAKQRCDRLNDQLATIQARMRAGYSVREGERLRERQRSLEAQRRTERCRR
jgi:flagellar motility protein MotE (MotC chaperone)